LRLNSALDVECRATITRSLGQVKRPVGRDSPRPSTLSVEPSKADVFKGARNRHLADHSVAQT
jgi:hypothetical protein